MSEDVGYKQVLTRKDLFGIAVGMIIGAGVMTLTWRMDYHLLPGRDGNLYVCSVLCRVFPGTVPLI